MSKLVVLILALALPMLSFAEDKDAQEINRYVLTDAGLSRYIAAIERLRPYAGKITSCDDTQASSIGAMAARIDRIPTAKSAITAAGLTTREYVVFSFAMFQAGMAAWSLEQGGALPPGVSKANVDFYRKNRAKIDGVPPLDDGDCDETG